MKNGLQSKICKILHLHQPWEWPDVLERRASLLCFDEEPTNIDWEQFYKTSSGINKKLGPSLTMSLLKTWLNSWTTTERMDHDDSLRRCIFCGNEGDALQHYLRCDPLWTCITSVFQLPASWLVRTPAQRIGFVDPTLYSFLQVVVAFRAYHSMKARNDQGNATGDFSTEISWALDLIRHHFYEVPKNLRMRYKP